eukprot:333640_1
MDEVILDAEVDLSGGDATIGISAGNKMVSLSALLTDIEIKGTLRVVFARLCPDWPLFNSLRIAFIEKPHLKYKLKAVKVPLSNIPGFVPWVTDMIQNSLSFLIWPNELIIHLDEYGATGAQSKINSPPQPKGVLRVRVIEAKNLQARDLFGKSDPMAVVWVNRPKLNTRKIPSTLNPIWDEVFEFTIFDRSTENLQIAIENCNFSRKNDKLGNVTIDLSHLKDRQTDTKWYKLQNTKVGAVHIELCYSPFLLKKKTEPQSEVQSPELNKKKSESSSYYSTNQIHQPSFFGEIRSQSFDVFDDNQPDECSKESSTDPMLDRQASSLRKLPKIEKVPDFNQNCPPNRRNKLAQKLKLTQLSIKPSISSSDRCIDGILRIAILSAKQLRGVNRDGTSDPFVMLKLGDKKLKTSVKKKTNEPNWNESFQIRVNTEEIQNGTLYLQVKDHDKWTKNACLGALEFKMSDIMAAHEVINKEFELQQTTTGSIHIEIELLSVYSPHEITLL